MIAPSNLAVVTLVYSARQMEPLGIRGSMTLRLCASHAADATEADPPAATLAAEAGTPCDFCCVGAL